MVMESLQRLDPPRQLGKMTLLARLGEGGMANVYVAAVGQGPLARLAAVKLVRAGAPDHDYRTRFLDEARVVVRLHHNNLVDVREAGEVDGQLYITMELVEGRDLADVWNRCAERGRAFPVALAVHLVREILRGLHYAHVFPGLSLVHRDVSPSNILLDWAGAVRLADFGLATSAMKAAHTVAGLVFGKVGYMAPEQAVRGDLDGRTDVYGCAVVLWELLTGRPLRPEGIETKDVATFEAVPPSTHSRRVDPDLDAIVSRALATDPQQRYPDARAFLQALSDWLAEHAPQTNQETVASFMAELFGDARKRDHEVYTELLGQLPRTGVWDRTGRRVGPTRSLSGPRVRDPLVSGGTGRPTEEIRKGVVLATRYRVEGKLGRGGMGTVYLAEHLTVGRKVAVKVLTHEWSRHETVARRFREEARAASAAGHPNIVEVFDAGTLSDGRLYLVMEHLTGRSLYEEIVDSGPLPVERASRIIREVARAVAAAHEVGIIHRDLKPDNVMLVTRGDEEIVKVLDFGISASAVRSADEQRLTQPGHTLGTPEYMAPEQARGLEPAPTFDIYALGVLLYEALCGQAPFESDNMVEVLTRKATEPAPPLLHQRPDVPGPLAELVHRCLEIEPERRFQTLPEFLDALGPIADALTAGLPIHGTLASAGFDSALEDAADRSRAYRSAPEDAPVLQPEPTGLVAAPRRARVSDAVPAARRRRLAIGLSAGALVVAIGLLWWRLLPAGTGGRAETSERDEVVRAEVDPLPIPAPHDADAVARKIESPATGLADAEVPSSEGADAAAVEPSKTHKAKSVHPPASDKIETSVDPPVSEPPTTKDTTKRARAPSPDKGCSASRQKAEAAYARRDFPAVLAHLTRRCWRGSKARAYKRMRVEALFQTGRYGDCVREGEGSSDARVQKVVSYCRRKG